LTPVQQPQYQQRPPQQNPFFGLTVGDASIANKSQMSLSKSKSRAGMYTKHGRQTWIFRASRWVKTSSSQVTARLLKTIPGTQFTCFTSVQKYKY
jgi:hypothetical protein